MIRITIAVAARGANMATRFTNDSTVNDSVSTCYPQAYGPDCPLEHSANAGHLTTAKPVGEVGRKPTLAQKLLLMATLGFLLYPTVGCTLAGGLGQSLVRQERLDKFLVDYRNQAWAAKAWHCRKQKFCNKRYLSDFERGFRDGYASVAKGGNGCVPAVCPQSYWGWQYQTGDGQARMDAWFEAFPMGVQAAEQDGIGHWGQLRTSLPYPAAAAAPAALGTAVMAPIPMTGMAAESRFSDQAEAVPVPAPEPMMTAPMTKSAAPPVTKPAIKDAGKTAAKATETPDVKTRIPELTKPSSSVPRNVDAPLTPLNPAPKVEAAVPQPTDDPFGFE